MVGRKIMTIGNSSNLPASISNDRISLLMLVKLLKLSTGPTTPSPGPTLFKQQETAPNVLSKSIPCDNNTNREITMMHRYRLKYACSSCITPVGTGLFSI